MKIVRLFLASVFALTMTGAACHTLPAPVPASTCAAACSNLVAKSCLPNGGKSPKGKPCEEWLCPPPITEAHLDCYAKASDCATADHCTEAHGAKP